jgi:hypothetical protein
MANLGSFDASTVEPRTAFEVVPPGEYLAQIVKSDLQPTKNGTGQRLSLELDILEGQYQGRKLFDGLNIVNQSAQAQEIGQRTLSAICHAVGKLQVRDSEELHFKPMRVKVKVVPPKDGYSEKNEITGYSAANGSKPAAFTAPKPATAAAPAAAKPPGNVPPWKRAG